MSPIQYSKRALSYSEQLQKLIYRGLTVHDKAQALNKLQHYNYYRLGAYWLPFESDHNTHQFVKGTTIEDVLRLYDFDRKLRLVVFDAIERIEVSVRAQWAYHMGHNHGAHAHLDPSIARNTGRWRQQKIQLKEEVDRSDEAFIIHLKNKYGEDLPPVWAVCEVMSLGLLSRWYSNLEPLHTRQAIADVYDMRTVELKSWLHHLTAVRNQCAHHSRLWNRNFSRILPDFPRNRPEKLLGEFISDPRIYNTLLIITHMMDVMQIGAKWKVRLVELLQEHDDHLPEMGFPDDWQSKEIWVTN